MDRCWLLTSTTYGTWLPGDQRGFVSHYSDESLQRIFHHTPGEPYDANILHLVAAARQAMNGAAVYLSHVQADRLLEQFQETALHRQWTLLAVGIMTWHFHLVVGVDGDPDPERILADFKSYGSRALNLIWGRRPNGTWWTTSGSKRKLPTEAAVEAAIRYVQEQQSPLLIWTNPMCRDAIEKSGEPET